MPILSAKKLTLRLGIRHIVIMSSTTTTIIAENKAEQIAETTCNTVSTTAGGSSSLALPLFGSPGQPTPKDRGQGPFESYPYTDLLPKVYPNPGEIGEPLEDFVHVDPGMRALSHLNPRKFLQGATRIENFCPTIGTEIEGVNLVKLTPEERDELALEVARRRVLVGYISKRG